MKFEAIVVGGGIAGLTAASYLAKAGKLGLLCDKADHLGGLVGSITTDGHVLEFGIRAFENSGIVKPILKQLDINPQFVKSPVTIGIGHDFISLSRRESLNDNVALLMRAFPDDATIKHLSRIH